MKRFFHVAVPLIFFVLLLVSCSNAQTLYEKGNYEGAINKISKSKSATAQDYLLKAKCHIAQGNEEKALESLLLFLLTEDGQNAMDHQFAIEHFLQVNTSDKLTVMIVSESDGIEALKALYCAHSRLKDFDKAKAALEILSDRLDFIGFVDLILSAPVDMDYILDVLSAWYSTIPDEDLSVYLARITAVSRLNMNETEAKRFLQLTDVLMANEYYTSENLMLSALLKVKGNILEKLFDKVNARIYWSQAYKLNPQDEELGKRLQ